MEEELFTREELEFIAEEAKNPRYSVPNLHHLGSKKTSIRGVSQENGLIMPYGNKDTGYMHINERHGALSRIPKWLENHKLDNPTKFDFTLPPINYLYVASEIFKPENLNNNKNNKTDLFDLYVGKYKNGESKAYKYRLLIYKGTKIIHTFYLFTITKPFNKKFLLDLRQGYTYGSHDLYNGLQIYNWNYYDHKEIELYRVIIRFLEFPKLEKWYIQVNTNEGIPFLTTYIGERLLNVVSYNFTDRAIQLDFEDIEWVEEIIKLIIENKYHF